MLSNRIPHVLQLIISMILRMMYYFQTKLHHLMLVIIGGIIMSNCVILMTVMVYWIICMTIFTATIGLVLGLLPLTKDNSHDYVVTLQQLQEVSCDHGNVWCNRKWWNLYWNTSWWWWWWCHWYVHCQLLQVLTELTSY